MSLLRNLSVSMVVLVLAEISDRGDSKVRRGLSNLNIEIVFRSMIIVYVYTIKKIYPNGQFHIKFKTSLLLFPQLLLLQNIQINYKLNDTKLSHWDLIRLKRENL